MTRYLCFLRGIHDTAASRAAGVDVFAPTPEDALAEAADMHGLTEVPAGSIAVAVQHHA